MHTESLSKIMKKQKKYVRIKPKYIKNSKGKTIQVFLDISSYKSMMDRVKEFDVIKKRFESKKA